MGLPFGSVRDEATETALRVGMEKERSSLAADPDIRDPQGRTALQNAERLGFGEIAALIRAR